MITFFANGSNTVWNLYNFIISVYSVCLSVMLVTFGFGRCQPDGYLGGEELGIFIFMCAVENML